MDGTTGGMGAAGVRRSTLKPALCKSGREHMLRGRTRFTLAAVQTNTRGTTPFARSFLEAVAKEAARPAPVARKAVSQQLRGRFIMKPFIATASVLALMAIPAFAQDTTVPKTEAPAAQTEMAPAPMPASPTTTSASDISAEDLLNTSVKNAANESIGDVNDVRLDSDGKIGAVIVGVGGFLGLGEKDVALPFDQLTIARDANGALVVTSKATKESLQAAPEWKDPDKRS
jgi:hypothetical protein